MIIIAVVAMTTTSSSSTAAAVRARALTHVIVRACMFMCCVFVRMLVCMCACVRMVAHTNTGNCKMHRGKWICNLIVLHKISGH
jgi:hypothetical protein